MRHTFREYLQDAPFRKIMIGIATPIILQMLLTNGLSFVDTMMIGRLGEEEVAAVGLANQMFFLVFLIFFGITSGTGIFVAQFWGDKDYSGIHRVTGLSLAGVLIFAVPFALVSWIWPYKLLRLFTQDPAVIQLGGEYLRIVAFSYIFSGVSFAYAMSLRSVEQPRIPLLATAVSMGLNSVLNLLLIFGLMGFPALGVRGAAIATFISRGVELLVILICFRRTPVASSVREYLGFDSALVKKFVKTSGPVVLNEIVWALGMVAYKMIYARMGTDVIAAANVTESIFGLFFVVLIGTGNTAAIMIGKKIGERNNDDAYRYARYFMLQALVLGVFLGILMAASAPAVVLLLKMQPETLRMVRRTLVVLGILLPVKSNVMHLVVGVLRSGGDTTYSFLIELIAIWGIGVPVAYVAGLVLGFDLPVVYLLAGLEEVVKSVVLLRRFRSGKWLNNLISE